MNRPMGKKLTASQEDYLEAIWALIWNEGIARVRDIAGSLGVSMSSVTGALKALAKRGFVEHSPHKYVTLTDRGMELAERICTRHGMLKDFLTEVLNIKPELADRNACRIEHAVDEVVSRRLSYLVQFLSESPRAGQWAEQFKAFCDRQEAAAADAGEAGKGVGASSGNTMPEPRAMKLADIKPGERARIVAVTGSSATNGRLIEVGIAPDSVASVIRVAPLGDPLEIEVAGRRLAIRKTEAMNVEVEKLA